MFSGNVPTAGLGPNTYLNLYLDTELFAFVFKLEITHVHGFVFDLYLKGFAHTIKYTYFVSTKGKAMPHILRLAQQSRETVFLTCGRANS